jgi:hypothetical protein
MDNKLSITPKLIAPCGMDCGVCMAYLRDNNHCSGCNSTGDSNDFRARHCELCAIRNCQFLEASGSRFCFKCEKFPCARIKNLDKRYRTKYHMSMIENLGNIQISGIREFVKNEKLRWTCPQCGGPICVHRGHCAVCGYIGLT